MTEYNETEKIEKYSMQKFSQHFVIYIKGIKKYCLSFGKLCCFIGTLFINCSCFYQSLTLLYNKCEFSILSSINEKNRAYAFKIKTEEIAGTAVT